MESLSPPRKPLSVAGIEMLCGEEVMRSVTRRRNAMWLVMDPVMILRKPVASKGARRGWLAKSLL